MNNLIQHFAWSQYSTPVDGTTTLLLVCPILKIVKNIAFSIFLQLVFIFPNASLISITYYILPLPSKPIIFLLSYRVDFLSDQFIQQWSSGIIA